MTSPYTLLQLFQNILDVLRIYMFVCIIFSKMAIDGFCRANLLVLFLEFETIIFLPTFLFLKFQICSFKMEKWSSP